MTSSLRHYFHIKYSLVIKSFNELSTLIHFRLLRPTKVTLVYSQNLFQDITNFTLIDSRNIDKMYLSDFVTIHF